MVAPSAETIFSEASNAISARRSPKKMRPGFAGTAIRSVPGSAPGQPAGSAAGGGAAKASSVASANGVTQSRLRHAGTTPAFEIRPGVGLNPTILLSPAGTRPDPAVSVPSASGTRPAATATAEPELDPPGLRCGSSGLRGTP